MSEKWDVGEMGCRRNGMSEKWDVSQIKLFFPTGHYSDKIRTSEASD